MAFNITDFNKIWASTSPLTPYAFTESNYKQGWNFVGSTPPSRQMWDAFMQNADEKSQWLYNETVRINQVIIQDIPVGIVQAFAGATTPDGWLLCDGSAVSRTEYADLYAVIGDTYGNGDGVETFNLPDLIDKFVEGSATAGTAKAAGLPDVQGLLIVGVIGESTWDVRNATGAFSTPAATSATRLKSNGYATRNASDNINFKASNYNSIYGNSATVQPPAVTMRYIIKY